MRLAPVLSRSKKIRTLKRRAPKCGNCARKGAMYQKLDSEINNAVVFAVDWGNKPFCEDCYQKYKAKKKIERDSREEIVIGPGVTKVIISEGDMLTYPQIHEWVKIDYAIRRQGDSRVIDSSAKRGKPLLYQAVAQGRAFTCRCCRRTVFTRPISPSERRPVLCDILARQVRRNDARAKAHARPCMGHRDVCPPAHQA